MSTAMRHPVTPDHLGQEKAKILLVDDSPENLLSLEAALEGLGQDVVLAQSGTEALRHLLEDDFAVILLDVKMPELDGFQTAELIRSRRRSRHTPILFLTAYKSDEHLFRGYDMGAVDFLFKPIVPEILRSKVGVFVELSHNAVLLQRQTDVLRKAELKFRSLLEAAPDAMIISGERGDINLVNSQVEKLFGFRREELIGRGIDLLIPDWRADSAEQAGTPRDVTAKRRDGSEFPAEMSVSPLQIEEGVLVTSAVRDVTERKKRDDQIRELNMKLEHRVAERTQELVRSNDALRQSNEDLNQFAYAASHDLQEPLRMVSLYSEMLQAKYADRLDPDANQFINFVVSGARRMEVLLRDLLAYSQAGSSEGPPTPVNCAEVIGKVLLNLHAAVRENKAQIEWGDLPIVDAHEIRMLQLFQNLVGNAIKYRRADCAPHISISATRRDTEWLFAVEDNGIGIRPEYAQQVFGIFKRLHGHTYPGTGIGLAICQRIVERYGGRIWVESRVGEGSKFCFTLPVSASQTLPQTGPGPHTAHSQQRPDAAGQSAA